MEELPVEEALLRHNHRRIRLSLPQHALDFPSARPVNQARLIFAQLFHERAMVHLRLLSHVRSRILHNSRLVYQFLGTGSFSSGGLLDYKKRYKDNREITAETLQFNIRKSNNAFFTDKFFEYSPFIYKGTTDLPLYVAYSTTETYNELDKNYKGTLELTGTTQLLNIVIAINQIYIAPTSSGTSWWNANALNMVSWAICDASGKIIVARNKRI
jgi:hypothetical protein